MIGDERWRALAAALVVVVSAMAVPPGLVGTAAAQTTGFTTTAGTSDFLAGAADQTLADADGFVGPLYLNETTDDSLGTDGTVRLVVPAGENVTFNTTASNASDVVLTNGTTTNARFVDARTLEVNYSGFSTAGPDRLAFGTLAVDVATAEDFRLRTEVSVDGSTALSEQTFIVDRPQLSGGGTTANAADQDVSVPTLTVDLPTNNGSIAAGSEIVVRTAPESNVTFDDALGPDDLSVNYDQADGRLDVDNLSVDGNRLVIPVNESFGFNGQITGRVTVSGVRVDVAPSATTTDLSLRTVPERAIDGVTVESTSDGDIVVERPSVDYLNDTVAVAANEQVSTDLLVQPTADGQIESGENITIEIVNTQSASFDKSNDIRIGGNYTVFNNVAEEQILNNQITVRINESSVSKSERILFDRLKFNVSSEPSNDSEIGLIVKTGPSGQVVSQDKDGSTIRAVTPTIQYPGDTVSVGASRTAVPLSNVTVRANDDRNVGPNTTIDVVLPVSSQVTFNQSAIAAAPNVTYNSSRRASYQVETAPAAGEEVVISGLAVDLTADSRDAVLDVVTDTGDGTVTQKTPNELTVLGAVPDAITADVDGDGQFGTDATNTTREVLANRTTAGAVRVTNGSVGLTNRSVSLTVTDAPAGADSPLNASSVRTDDDGVARFTVSPNVTGTYVIEATVGNVSIDLTYDAILESVADLDVEGRKDAVVGGPTADTNVAVYELRLVDAQGNVVDDTAVDLTASTDDGTLLRLVGAYDPATGTENGSLSNADNDTFQFDYDPAVDPADPGVVYALVDVNGTTPGPVTLSAEAQLIGGANGSGTAIAHDLTGTAVTVSKPVPAVGETVTVTATGTNASGETVPVPRLPAQFGTDNATVLTQPTPSPATTDVTGTATATATADAVGETTASGRVADGAIGERTVRVESLAAATSTATIEASPGTTGATATHTLTLTVGNESAGEPLSALTVDYDVGDPPADVTAVDRDAVTAATLNGDPLTANLTGVTTTGGTVLELGFDGSVTLARGDRLVFAYENVTNPTTAGETRTEVAVNEGTPPVDRPVAFLSVTRPDAFVVDNLSAPTTATTGETVTVAADVTNTNTTPIAANATVRFDADGNGALAADETVETRNLTLNGSETRRLSFEVVVPQVDSGTYSVGVFAGNASQTALVDVTTAEQASPDAIAADLDGDGQFGTDAANTTQSVPVGETRTSALVVTNESRPVADARVNLTVTSPDGTAATDLLNTSTVRTGPDGIARFTVSPPDLDTFVVNATAGRGADAPSVTLTYTTTPGPIDRLAVSGLKDGVVDGPRADTNLAAYAVRLEDSNGGLVTDAGVDVRVQPERAGASVAAVVGAYDPATGTRNGTLTNADGDANPYDYDPTADPADPGVFYALIDVNGTSPGPLSVTVEPGVGGIGNDSGTAVAHDLSVTTVTLDPSVAVAGRSVAVTARGTNASGGPVAVPRLPVNFGSNDLTIASDPSPTDTLTGLDGSATATTTTVATGSVDVFARVGDASLGATRLTVENVTAGRSTVGIDASPATVNATAAHTVTVRVGSLSDDRSLESLTVAYGEDGPANGTSVDTVDVSGVTRGDIRAATLDGTNLSANVTGVTPTANGTALDVTFDGTVTLDRTDRLVVRVDNVSNPTVPASVAANVSVNPGVAPLDVAATGFQARQTGPLTVGNLSAPVTAVSRQRVQVAATVTNAGPNATAATVDLRIDGDGDGRLSAGDVVADRTVEVNATDSRRVAFSAEIPEVANGSYLLGVFAGNDSRTALTTVRTPVTPFPEGLPGGNPDSGLPTDPNADGLYEDLDGDGDFDFVDVIEFVFAIDAIQNTELTEAQVAAIDFDGSGSVDFVDVIDLVFRLPN